MINSIVLTINGRNFGNRLSTYKVTKEITYGKVVTTLAGKEFASRKRIRPIVEFSLLPYTDDTAHADYEVLKSTTLNVTFTDTDTGATLTKEMRVASDIEHTFLLDSIDGNRYYKGGRIILRSNTVL